MSSCFIRARTNKQTDKQTDATEQPTHAGVGKNFLSQELIKQSLDIMQYAPYLTLCNTKKSHMKNLNLARFNYLYVIIGL